MRDILEIIAVVVVGGIPLLLFYVERKERIRLHDQLATFRALLEAKVAEQASVAAAEASKVVAATARLAVDPKVLDALVRPHVEAHRDVSDMTGPQKRFAVMLAALKDRPGTPVDAISEAIESAVHGGR